MKQLLAILFPALELFLFIKVGQLIGGLATVALVFGSAGFGFWLIRVRCKNGVNQVVQTLAEGDMPKQAIVDNVLLFCAGILFIIPGILTDCLGLLLLFPFLRNIIVAKAGSALYRYSQTVGSPLHSATNLFVYNRETGSFQSAHSSDEAERAFSESADPLVSSRKESPENVIFDCEPVSSHDEDSSTKDSSPHSDCTFREP